MKNWISPKSIQTIRLSIPIAMQSLKWIGKGVLNLQRDIQKIALKSRTIWWIKSHNSGMKIRNFTIKLRPSIPITLCNLKWIGQGVLKLERDMWNGRTDRRTLVYHNTSRLTDGRIKINHFIIYELGLR
jgi:hypothetical protein